MNPKGTPANLKPFKPGQSGNPGGRPKKRPISDRYAAIVERPLEEEVRQALKLPRGATYGDAIVLGQARIAIKGKTDAAKEIREAIEGKATQRIEVKDLDEGGEKQRIRSLTEEELERELEAEMLRSGYVI